MSLGTIMPGLMKPCTRLLREDGGTDGLLGRNIAYTDGDSFMAFIRKDQSQELTLAEARGARERYTVVVEKGIALNYDDVIRRDADGLVLRILSGTLDSEAPDQSTVPIAAVQAERWDLPS